MPITLQGLELVSTIENNKRQFLLHAYTLRTKTQCENFNSNYLDKAGCPESASKAQRLQ